MQTLSGELSHGTVACANGGAGLPSADLLLEVDFKWLMAGQGCWIDPARLHHEPGYALDCVRAAINSPCDALRRCARALQATIGQSAS